MLDRSYKARFKRWLMRKLLRQAIRDNIDERLWTKAFADGFNRGYEHGELKSNHDAYQTAWMEITNDLRKFEGTKEEWLNSAEPRGKRFRINLGKLEEILNGNNS